MFKRSVILIAFLSSLCLVNSYRILYLCPLPGKSHAILSEGIVRHLVEAGHEVTYMATNLPEKSRPGMTVIDLSDNIKLLDEDDGPLNLKALINKEHTNNIMSFIEIMINLGRMTLENPNLQKILADKNQHFDLFITEWLYAEAYAGIAAVFNCPMIWLSTVEPHWMVLQKVDEVPNPAYNVDTMSTNVPPLSFDQRVLELVYQVMGKFLQIYYASTESKIYEEIIVPHIRNRGHRVPSLDDLKYNVSLILSNSHVSMGTAASLPPNFIPIGGYHIDSEVKPLSKHLQNLMDNSKDGVIYFSMGTNLRSKHFPVEIREELLRVFGELKQTVLWKFEEDLPNKPSNVHILQWAPQQSILAHKNCKMFITHGGLLSTTETIHFGVPVIGIPVFADQFINVERGVKKGYAYKVDLSYSLAADLKVAIQEVLSNPSYSTKVKELSTIYHHRAIPPSKEMVHWVEHVVKTGGARHLRTPAFLMPWYQKLYLDLVLVVIAAFIALKYLCCYVCSLFRKRRITTKKKQN